MGVINDQREVPSELHDAGQLAAMLDGMADRLGSGVIDGEHGNTLQQAGRTDHAQSAAAAS